MKNADGSHKVPSPIAVDCPFCFAKPLEHCTSMGGRSCPPHAKRIAATKIAPVLGTITTGTGPAPRPSWGLPPDEGVLALAAWGARAIFKGGDKISLLWDRQGGAGHNASLMELISWLDAVALPELRAHCKAAGLAPWSTDTFNIDAGRFFLRATPKASHGYLYIGAWVTPVGGAS